MNCFPIAMQYGQSSDGIQDDIDFAVDAIGSVFDSAARFMSALSGGAHAKTPDAKSLTQNIAQKRFINHANHRLNQYNAGHQVKIKAIH